MRLVLVVLILPFIVGQLAIAQDQKTEESGNEFLGRCSFGIVGPGLSTSDEAMEAIHCLSYLDGFLDGAVLVQSSSDGKLFCLPTSGITISQFGRIAVKWMEHHPARLHESARLLILISLMAAFPCPGATP